MAPRLREVIASIPEIRGVMSHVGRPDDGTDVTSFFNLEFNAPLIPMEQWRTKPVMILGPRALGPDDHPRGDPGRADGEVQGVPGGQLQLLAVDPRQRRGGALGRQGGQLDQALRQRPGRRWRGTASGCVNILNTVPGIENVGLFHIVGQPNLEIQIDRQECARYGINVADVEAVVQVAIGGRAFTQMVEGEKLFDIVLRLPMDQRDDPEVIGRIPVDAPPAQDGKPGRGSRSRSWSTIDPHKPGAIVHLPREQPPVHPDQVQRPGPRPGLGDRRGPGEGRRPQGRRPAARRATTSTGRASSPRCRRPTQRLMWIVPLSIGLIMILLYTAFNSLKDALLVMVNVVAATMGGVWALKLTGTPFSISAAVGFISIFGVAVQDGVLLISYFNQMRAAGLPVREARDARGRAAGPARGHDLADRGPRAVARPPWPTRSARRRRSRWRSSWSAAMLVHPVPDPLPDAGALLLLPGPGRATASASSDLIAGLALHRPVPPARRPSARPRRWPRSPRSRLPMPRPRPSPRQRGPRRSPVMKNNWKTAGGRRGLIAAGATVAGAQQPDPGPASSRRLEAAVSGARPTASETPAGQDPGSSPPPGREALGPDASPSRTPGRSRRSAWRRSRSSSRPSRRSCRSPARPTTTRRR